MSENENPQLQADQNSQSWLGNEELEIEDAERENGETVREVSKTEFRLTKDLVAKEGDDENHESARGRKKRKKKVQAAARKQKKLEEVSQIFHERGWTNLGPQKLSLYFQVARFRKQHRIYVYGTDIPDPCPTFEAIIEKYDISEALAETIREQLANWTPTPIQMQAIPLMLQARSFPFSFTPLMVPVSFFRTVSFWPALQLDLERR